MLIENKVIDTLCSSDLAHDGDCLITNSIIQKIDFVSFEAQFPITIKKCIINQLLIHTCWFRRGFLFVGNYVNDYVDYQMGGHNHSPIVIRENIFNRFFNFFDCQFLAEVTVEHNIFLKGSNLLGNIDTGFKNQFEQGVKVNNNIGNVNLDVVHEF